MKVNRLLMSMAVLPFVLYSCSSDKGRITPVPFLKTDSGKHG